MSTAINFPNIVKPSFPLEQIIEDGVLRSQFENGMEQTRNRFTRRRVSYVLRWGYMKPADWTTLETFFFTTIAGGALSFNWTHPLSGVTKEYRFTEPIKCSLNEYNAYTVQATIREV